VDVGWNRDARIAVPADDLRTLLVNLIATRSNTTGTAEPWEFKRAAWTGERASTCRHRAGNPGSEPAPHF